MGGSCNHHCFIPSYVAQMLWSIQRRTRQRFGEIILESTRSFYSTENISQNQTGSSSPRKFSFVKKWIILHLNKKVTTGKLLKDNKFSRLSERNRSKESILQKPKRGRETMLDQQSDFHNQRFSLISANSKNTPSSPKVTEMNIQKIVWVWILNIEIRSSSLIRLVAERQRSYFMKPWNKLKIPQ